MHEPLTPDELADMRSWPEGNRNGSTIDRVDRLLATIDVLTAERDSLAAWKAAAEPALRRASERLIADGHCWECYNEGTEIDAFLASSEMQG